MAHCNSVQCAVCHPGMGEAYNQATFTPLFAATVRATGYDPHAGQFVGTPRDPSTGRFVKAGAR